MLGETEAEQQKGAEDCSSDKSKAQAARTLSKQAVTETKVQPSNKAASNDTDGTLAETIETIIEDTPMIFAL